MPARISDKRSRQKYGTRYGAPTGQPGSGAAQGKRKYGSGRDTARVQISLGSNSWHANIHSKSMIPQPGRHSKDTRHTEVGKNLGTQDSVYLCTHILSQAITAARGGQGRPGAARGEQGRPGAARGGQGQPGAARGSQGRPEAARGGQGQPRAAKGGQRATTETQGAGNGRQRVPKEEHMDPTWTPSDAGGRAVGKQRF